MCVSERLPSQSAHLKMLLHRDSSHRWAHFTEDAQSELAP